MYKTAMEQNGSQWLGAPSCSRGSFAFYKSVSCRGGPAESEGGSSPGGPGRVWKLGGFYFVRCSPQEPVCIAEVTLLWEDQTQRHLLASSRLYFLPEDTPRGRTRDHGEDEVIAVSKRIVVRVDDLAKWACTEPPLWRSGRVNGSHQLGTTSPSSDAEQSKENTQGDGVGVRVLSYPQYCRYRSLRKRVEELGGSASAWQQEDPHLKTLEDIRASMVQQNTRVLYCRDIFTHPTLNNNTSVLAQLGWPSLRLKGRPRKRRGIYARIPEQSDLPQGEGWKEQMNDTVLGDAELQWSGGWMQHPEQQLFLDQLFSFMERRGSPIGKVPNLGFKKIDLFLMYNVVKKLGGYDNVTNQRMWKTVYNELGGSPGSTSAATCTRRHYERLMLPFEQSLCSGSKPASAQVVLPKRPRGRPPLHLQKKNSLPPPAPTPKPPQVVTVDGVVVVKRGRGRPPGRRKLMAARANSNNNQQGSTPLQPAPSPSQVKAAPPIPTQGPDAPLPSPALPNSTLFQAQVSTPTSATSTPPLAPQSNSIKQETAVVPTTPQLGRPVTRFNGVPRATSSRNASESATSKLSSGPSQTLPGALAPTMPKSSSVSQAELAPPAPSASKSAGFSQGSSPTAAAAPAAAVVVVGSSSSPTVFSPTKGLCPLDLFRTKMGLGAMAQALDSASSRLHVPSPSPSSVSRHPMTPSGPGTSSPTSTPTPTSTSTPVRPADAQPSPALQHQRSGSCTNDQGVLVEVGPSAAAAVLQPQPQPQPQRSQPPLRILPLELGCSLQVRQLMLNSLSSEHVQCFTKRLSEALADVGPTPQPPPSQTQTHLPQSSSPSATPSCSLALASPPNPSAPITSSPQGEQAQPLNLTMWGAYKRPADGGDHPEGHRDGDDNGPRPPVAKLSRLDKDGLPLMHNVGGVFRFPLFQDQPADLSLPCRLRAILRDSRCLSAKSPDRSERHRHSTPLRAESTPLRAESTPMKLESTPLQTESTGIDPLDPSCRTEVSSRAVEEVQGGAVGLVDGAPVEVKEEGGGVSPGGVLHSGGGDGSGGTPMEVDSSSSSSSSSSKEAADVPSIQRNGATDRGAALENRADVSRVGHGELSNGKAGASGDQKMLTNGDLTSECSHEELANGQSDAQAGDGVQAAGRPDIQDCHMPRTNGDRDTDHEHVASANGHPDARDEQMQLASERPDICNDHIALANRQSDAHDALDELANGHSDACTEHMPLVNGGSDASTEIKASANGDLDAHDEQLQLANGHSDVHDEEIELANGEPDACEESMLFANGDSDAHNKLMALASGDSDVHEDEDHETYTEGSFISLVLPESPPHSHCNSISNTLLS